MALYCARAPEGDTLNLFFVQRLRGINVDDGIALWLERILFVAGQAGSSGDVNIYGHLFLDHGYWHV